LYETFLVENCIKQAQCLSPLLLKFALEYTNTIKNAQENHVRLKLNGTHQMLLYAGDVNLLEDNINTIKENTKVLDILHT
jgi:mannitol-1-phosphate/altronate dehydrogenase